MKPCIELKTGSNLCVVTGYSDSCNEHGPFAARVDISYCLKHGYDFRAYGDECFDKKRFGAWSKVLFVNESLKDYQYVFWIDADATFTNHDKKIADLIKLGGDMFLCRQECDGDFNTGVFLIRSCDWSFWLLEEMWNTKGWDWLGGWEQSAFNKIYKEGRVGQRMVYYPMKVFNAIPDPAPHPLMEWQPGDFIAHRAGAYNTSERKIILTECLKKSGIVGI